MSKDDEAGAIPLHERWAHLRHSIVGRLLASPPRRGELCHKLEDLAAKTWRNPADGELTTFGASTIERWYYEAKSANDPVGALRKKRRSDAGQQPSMGADLRTALLEQYAQHEGWSYQLHFDNLEAQVEKKPELGPLPSYATVRRFMKANGLFRKRRRRPKDRPGLERALERMERREVRSYEVEYVSGLWHADFHHGSRPVVTPAGDWQWPVLLGILDDRSRLVPHAQWYLRETAQNVVHGLSQAFLKRDLPGELMTDNGAPFLATEVAQGLQRLGVEHATTLPYSPHQNAKQENFWARIEGRLMAMLEGCPELTLELLNRATQASVEMEYHREKHSETGQTPLERFLAGPSVAKPCPGTDALREAFGAQRWRTQRRSDGTVSIEGVRFEIPSRFRHLSRVLVRYVQWDLAHVFLVNQHTGKLTTRIYPIDKKANADSRRRSLEPVGEAPPAGVSREGGIAPLLEKLMADYAATGLPPAYVPQNDEAGDKEK